MQVLHPMRLSMHLNITYKRKPYQTTYKGKGCHDQEYQTSHKGKGCSLFASAWCFFLSAWCFFLSAWCFFRLSLSAWCFFLLSVPGAWYRTVTEYYTVMIVRCPVMIVCCSIMIVCCSIMIVCCSIMTQPGTFINEYKNWKVELPFHPSRHRSMVPSWRSLLDQPKNSTYLLDTLSSPRRKYTRSRFNGKSGKLLIKGEK